MPIFKKSEPLDLSRDYTKKLDTYFDRPFIKSLIKEIKKIDSSVWAVVYKELKMIIFLTGNIVFYKVMLTEQNIDQITIKQHRERAEKIFRLIKLNLVPIRELGQIKKEAARLDFKKGEKF
jgi:hypothetical protein